MHTIDGDECKWDIRRAAFHASVDASVAGLAPGEWPASLQVSLDTGGHVELELAGAIYRGGDWELFVEND